MKVLHLISSLNPKGGGVALAVHNFIVASSTNSITHEVLCLDSTSENYIKQKNYKVYALGQAKTTWKYHKDLINWLIINLPSYEVIIVHGLWQYQNYALTVALEKLTNHIPTIYVMPHGMLDPWFQRDKSRRIKALRNEIYWQLIEKKVLNSADGILFTCEEELLLARETFTGYKPKAEHIIGLGIESPPAFSGQASPLASGKSYWLFLSRIHPKKGVDLLIDAYLMLRLEQVNMPDLLIAGPLDSDYAKSMQLRTKLNPHIHFTDMLQDEAKWAAFHHCEAFILPSHQENFGIAVAEALACAKPVLISNQINIWREIAVAEAGLVAPDNLMGCYKLMREYLNITENEKIKMSINARKAYEKHFTIEQAAIKLMEILKQNN